MLVKQVAYVINKIHQQGFLYLDTKPNNILVVDGLRSRIQLFDFDSLISIKDITSKNSLKCSDLRLSYSKGFAPVELQTARIGHIGRHTGIEVLYLKEKYKSLVKNSIFEVTGKNYIVTFVRTGEILVEDDI